MIVRSSQTVVASSIKLPFTPTSGARQLGTAIAVSPDHVCTVLCTEARWIIILPARLPRIPVCSGWRYVMCGILHCCLYGWKYLYKSKCYLMSKYLYLVVGNTVHNECRYLPCHCCCFPACVPSSEYSYWVSTVDQVISSSLGTSPQSLPSHLHNTTPDPAPVI